MTRIWSDIRAITALWLLSLALLIAPDDGMKTSLALALYNMKGARL